jgi:glycosyltransferase involved in cell wall biosynthesis
MSPTPRILFLDQSGALGGAELYLLDLARAHRSTSHVLLLEHGPFFERLREGGVSAEVLPASTAVRSVRKHAGLLDGVRALPGLLRVIRAVARRAADYDLLFANTQKALLIGGLAGRWAGRPVVWNLHDLLTPDHFTAVNRTVAVTAANLLCRHVIANSRASRAAFEEAGGQVPTTVVYNGIDPAPFDAVSAEQVQTLRHELGLTDQPVVGVFSRLAPWKGQHVLLDALSDLPPSTHLLFVGDALFGGDQAYAASLRRQVAEQHAEQRVHFLGFRDDVPALMVLCDVVAHTSVAPEPFGRVIVEGMLASRPVVAPDTGGALEILHDAHTGALVRPDDPVALGTTLSALLSEPGRAQQMARAGSIHARQTFTPEAMQRGVQAALTQTLQ